MAKKKRTYNPNLIKLRHSYTLAEIAEVYKIHATTAHAWRKRGLKPIDETSKPFLFMGAEIRQFIKGQSQKRKHPLNIEEFFCPKCKTQRKSLPAMLSVEITNRRLGRAYKQALIKGVCEVCGQALLRFSSDRQVREWNEKGLLLMEHKKTLIGSGDSSLNTYI